MKERQLPADMRWLDADLEGAAMTLQEAEALQCKIDSTKRFAVLDRVKLLSFLRSKAHRDQRYLNWYAYNLLEFIRSCPWHPCLITADFTKKSKRAEECKDAWLQQVAAQPTKVQVYCNAANFCFRFSFKESESILISAIILHPESACLMLALSGLYLSQVELTKDIEVREHCLETARGLLDRAARCLVAGDSDEINYNYQLSNYSKLFKGFRS